mgnify:FL=1
MNLQEEKDLENTVGVSARRFEESPFIERQDTSKMVRGVYAGRFFAVYNGEDPIQKYWTLRRKALMFDVPEKPIEISGPDAVPFLEKIFSRKIDTMVEGRGYYAIACTDEGGIFMDGVIFKFDENRYRYVQADGPFETWLLAHSSSFKVKISDPYSRVLQIQGLSSIDIMKVASNGEINDDMKYFRSGFFDIGGQRLYVSRTGFTNELGFEIYCDKDSTDHIRLWDHLMTSGVPFGMEISSTRAMTIRRIEGGILGNITDIDTSMTPFEAGLGQFVDLGKGDFIGREALLTKGKKPLLFGLTCETETPTSGSIIISNGNNVGYITAGVPSPTLGLGIGYARFLEPKNWPGSLVSICLPDKTVHTAKVVDLPFFDPEKKIVRGVDISVP